MNPRIKSHIYRTVSVILLSAIISVAGCGSPKHIDKSLDDADRLMESRPDSALAILESMDMLDLKGKRERARYALLKSMALDKNYVDTTAFDILQPAIDYYLENGTPDEKLRTYYYQGRIYQNRNERDSALQSFMRGLDIAGNCRDSLTIARTLVVQGILYQSFYDYDGYAENYLKAADIFRKKPNKSYELECLFNALNGVIVLGRKNQADSLLNILSKTDTLNNEQRQRLHTHKLSYIFHFGSNQDLSNLIEANKESVNYDVNGMLNLARAYVRLGDNDMAIRQLNYLDEVKVKYDTLKYLSIKYPILENMRRYDEALAVYKEFVDKVEAINSAKFEQKSQSMEEKHRMELQAEREAMEHTKILWRLAVCVGTLILAMLIMFLMLRGIRIRKNLALEQVRAKELENGKLKAENELALEQARTSELENKNLKAENELALERARTSELENKNLKAENELALERARSTELENKNLRAEKELAMEQARATELENGKLKAENELALEQARTTELENKNLKAENELALEKARTAELENENLKTEKEKLELANENLRLERDNKALEAENLAHRVKELEGESENLRELLESQKEMPEEVRKAIQKRIEMLNAYLASLISDHREFEKAYDAWVAELTADKEKFMNSNRLAYQASHPAFIKYFEDHGLTTAEINYVCLYAIGLRGKDVGAYMKMRSHVNTSSAIRRKLGIDRHETNIGIYVRKKLQEL